MADVRLRASARRDLAEINKYGTTQFGPLVADAYSRGFHETFDLLRRHPLAGPARPELGKGIRCIVCRRHRIFYVVMADVVQILRVFHHSRDVQQAHFKQ